MVGLLLGEEQASESWVSMRRTHPQLGEHCCPHALPAPTVAAAVASDANWLDFFERFATMEDDDCFRRNLMILL